MSASTKMLSKTVWFCYVAIADMLVLELFLNEI